MWNLLSDRIGRAVASTVKPIRKLKIFENCMTAWVVKLNTMLYKCWSWQERNKCVKSVAMRNYALSRPNQTLYTDLATSFKFLPSLDHWEPRLSSPNPGSIFMHRYCMLSTTIEGLSLTHMLGAVSPFEISCGFPISYSLSSRRMTQNWC